MDFKRLELAKKKHPELIVGAVDCCFQHDSWCTKLAGGKTCNCDPDVTITTKLGKYSVAVDGTCKKLGIEAECLPVVYDPRDSSRN